MNKTALFIASLFCLSLLSCFKKHPINENALLQQRACVESIELKNFRNAQTYCELCLEFDKTMPECLNGLGLVALAHNDEEKALTNFGRALRQNSDYTQARNNIGVIHLYRGDYKEALKYFDRALSVDPANADARYNNALSHLRLAQRARSQNDAALSLRELNKAEDQINKLLALEPSYASAYHDLGVIELNRYDQNRFEEERKRNLKASKSAFEKCLSLDISNDACYEGLAQVLAEQGRFDLSFANYFLCLSHAPNNGACRAGIAATFEKSAHAEGGYKQFRAQVAMDAKNAGAHEAFCQALFERGLDKEARHECETALSLNPALCSAHYRLAEHYAALLNADQASSHCRAYLVCDASKERFEQHNKCREILVSLKH